MKNHTIQDRIAFRSSLRQLKEPSFRVLAGVGECPPDIQIEALALCFTLLTTNAGMDPHLLVQRAKRQITDADRVDTPHLEAIADFAKGELA